MSVCVGDSLGAVTNAGLGEEVVDVALDGGFAQDESLGDLGVRQPFSDQCEHFGFSLGQRVV